jgi:hypothetical protein
LRLLEVDREEEVSGKEFVAAAAEGDGSLDCVFELSDVAGPVVLL